MEDGYSIRISRPEDTEEMFRLLRQVFEGMADKDLFAVDDMDLAWMRTYTCRQGFGVTARDAAGELAGILVVCFPGTGEGNLGRDIGLSGEALEQVAHMDTAAVLPAHRGHRLEERMLRFAEEQLDPARWRYLMCTVSPRNPASLRSVERRGYRVAVTKEKYGGHLRHVLLKDRGGERA